MYVKLDEAMAKYCSQMRLYFEIGKAVCLRSEKGAAVAAAEYLKNQYPDVQGFSPRNLRRMRQFYRTYESNPALRELAMQIGWIQNVVIMEADLTKELRGWYIKAVIQFGWSKITLMEKIAGNAHEDIILAVEEDVCNIVVQEKKAVNNTFAQDICTKKCIRHLVSKLKYRCQLGARKVGRLPYILCRTSTGNQIGVVRC